MGEIQWKSLEVCLPELPEIWRHHYADLRSSVNLLAQFIDMYRAEYLARQRDGDYEWEENRVDYILGLIAEFSARRRWFHQDCRGIWLMKAPEEAEETREALQQLGDALPFTGEEQYWLGERYEEGRHRNAVAPLVVNSGRADLLDRCRAWLWERIEGSEEVDESEPPVSAAVKACNRAKSTFDRALH